MRTPDHSLIEQTVEEEPVGANGSWLTALAWASVGLATLLGMGGISYLSYVRLLPLEPNVVGALGTALGIGGLFGALVGFGLTLWQLIQTAASAQAAAKAVQNMKQDYGSLDAVAELAVAKGLNEAIRVSLVAKDRAGVQIRYDRLRESLVKVSSKSFGVSEKYKSYLKDTAAEIIDTMNVLRSELTDDEIPWNDIIKKLEYLDSNIIVLSLSVKEAVRGK